MFDDNANKVTEKEQRLKREWMLPSLSRMRPKTLLLIMKPQPTSNQTMLKEIPPPAKDDTIHDDFDTNHMPQDNTDPEEEI